MTRRLHQWNDFFRLDQMKSDVNGTNSCFHIPPNTANSTSSLELIFFFFFLHDAKRFHLKDTKRIQTIPTTFSFASSLPALYGDSSQWYVNLRWLYITCGACETFYYATSVPAELHFTYKRSTYRSFFFFVRWKEDAGNLLAPFIPIENVKVLSCEFPWRKV